MKKYFILLMALAGCQQTYFGLDEATWTTLSEPEREKVIDGYNKRREIALANQQKEREKELENEKHRREMEAQTAPFYAAADVITSLCDKKPSKKIDGIRIENVQTKGFKQTVTIGGTTFEVSPFSKMSDAWIAGQRVQIQKNDNFCYSAKIINLENGETVEARKK